MMRASSFFYPEHLSFTFPQKSLGGAGPPLGCPGGARELLPPPPV